MTRRSRPAGGPALEIRQLENQLKEGNIYGAYLVSGSDSLRRDQALRLLEESLCPSEMQQWCLVKVDAEESDGFAVLDLVSTPPFLGDRRVVVVKAAERLADDEALLPYVQDPPAFSILILVAGAFDKRKKLYQAIKRHGLVLEYEAPKEVDLERRVVEMARALELRMERGAVSALVEKAGDDLERIGRELEKLALFVEPGASVDRDLVEMLAGEGPPILGQYALFDYVDAVAEGAGQQALERLGRLMAAGQPPLVVLAMIARQFRLLLGAAAWRGERPEAMAAALGMKSGFPAKKAMAQVGRWPVAQIIGALEACAECDGLMKRGVDGRRALEILTVKLVQRRFQVVP